MKIKVIFITFYFLFFNIFQNIYSQTPNYSNEITDFKDYSEKAKKLTKLFPDSAIFYYQKALTLLDEEKKIKTSELILLQKTDIQTKIGHIFFQQSKYSFAAKYYNLALENAKTTGNDSLLAECFFNNGELGLENGKYANAVASYNEAMKLFEKKSNQDGLFWTNVGLGIVFRELGNKDLSIRHHEKSREIGENLNNKYFIAVSNNNIGNLYTQIGNYQTALSYLMKSLKSFTEFGDEKFVSDCYESIGNVYKELKEFPRAIEYFKLSTVIAENLNDNYRLLSRYANLASSFVSLNNNENALMYFSKTLELAQAVGDKARLSEIQIMLADFYKKNNDLIEAKNYLNKSIITSKEIGDTVSIITALNNLAELNLIEKNYSKAKIFAIEAYNIAVKKELPKHISEAAKILSETHNKLNDYKLAYNYLILHKNIEDSLLTIEKFKALEDIQAKYKLEQLETEKLRIQNQALTSKNEIQNRNLLILILIILIVISLFILGTFIYKKRKEKIIEKENANKLTKKIDLLNSQLNTKNRELTSKALMISSNNKILHEIVLEIDGIISDETGDKKKIRQLKNKLQSISEEESWKDFLQHFEEVHPEFYKKLNENYTLLTQSEQKICAFLKMNLNTKDIAQITNQTTKSVEVARTRIRKKLGIDHTESLTQAIHNL